MSRGLPARSEVDRRFTWKSESVFADPDGWEAAVAGILAALPDLAEFKGHLGDSPDTLADWFDATEKVHRLMEKVDGLHHDGVLGATSATRTPRREPIARARSPLSCTRRCPSPCQR